MDDVLALRRAGEVKKIGDARRVYEAQQRSGWDAYYTVRAGPRLIQAGAIEAARAGDVRRLVDCLRGRKPLTDDDRNRLVDYIATRARRRYWPPELVCALSKLPTEEKDYDWLADLVEAVGRRRGGVLDAPVHRAARLAEVFISLVLVRGRVPARVRTAMIERACEIEGDETGIDIDPERVHDLLKHPQARRRQQ
jgi:hypothetical protein